ncbi:MAG: hypothetical protein P1Q69_14680, partial [Candidatus Thorarchaeota archaeon]|nr:hypothetical protein [Candidatus Thorarchaeota archaeon]
MKSSRILIQKILVSIVLGMLLCSSLVFTASASRIETSKDTNVPEKPALFHVTIFYDPESP